MQYDISEVCDLFGLTPTSIRKYEEMGLIHPQRNASNKRKYTESDLRRLLRIKIFRQFGLSLPQINEQFCESVTFSRAEECEMLMEKERELELEIAKLERSRQFVRRFREALSQATETPTLREERMESHYLVVLPDFFGRTREELSDLARWLEYLPMTFVTERYDVVGDDIQQINGFAIPQAVAERHHLPLLDRAERIPGGPALHAVYWVPHEGFYGINPQYLLPLAHQAQAHFATDRLLFITRFLFRNQENGESKKCVEIWIQKEE